MANWLKSKELGEFKILIPKFRTDNNYTEFEIHVLFSQNMKFQTYRRYKEFRKLFDELVKTDDRYKINFPPKKAINNMCLIFLNTRRSSLEVYLNEIISLCSNLLPRKLITFLAMKEYEIHEITTSMAKMFYKNEISMLKSNNVFEISILSINAINQRICSPMPTNPYNKKKKDFGKVLEIVKSLKRVLITPKNVDLNQFDIGYGNSSIKMSSLTFDVSIFSNVTDLQIYCVEIANLRGLYNLNTTIKKLQVHYCLKSIESLLFADFPHVDSNIESLQMFDGPLRCTVEVNLSDNSIIDIDRSIVTLRQVHILNLSNNQISDINYLQNLTFLTELDLSYNRLYMCQTESLSNKLGSVTKLILKGNKLTSLNIVDRMFSLEYLDVSDNCIGDNVGLLSLVRLSCLESFVINNNPICTDPDFVVMMFDLFLDRYHNVKINGYYYDDIPSDIRIDINEYRLKIKLSIFSSNSSISNSLNSNTNLYTQPVKLNPLYSIDLPLEDPHFCDLNFEEIFNRPNFYNIFTYWFFVANGKYLTPKKWLWVTEIFAPNRNVRPLQEVLITSGTHIPNMLKCRLFKWFDKTKNIYFVTIDPIDALIISNDEQHVIIGADKSFFRIDITSTNRSLYLCNDATVLETFIGRLFNFDEGKPNWQDSRIVYLNEEDRVEMMQPFIHLWHIDLSMNLKTNTEILYNIDDEFVFMSRAMLEMKNGFQILLTVVIAEEIMYLVDERIYDWPDFNKQQNFTDLSLNYSCSPYLSSGGRFPFLRTNAYFLCQMEVCAEIPGTIDQSSIDDTLCPVFRYPVKITFNSKYQCDKDPLTLRFVNEQKTSQLCRIVHSQFIESSASVIAISPSRHQSTNQAPSQTEIPGHLRYLVQSYEEIRLSLSAYQAQLTTLARSTSDEILEFYTTKFSGLCTAKIFGLIWTKFIHVTWDSNEGSETTGLVCVSSNQICVLYETFDNSRVTSSQYNDDEEEDSTIQNTKLIPFTIDISNILRIFVGLNHQWLTLCFHGHDKGLESERLILMVRNKMLCKHLIGWTEAMVNGSQIVSEYAHQESDVKELLHQIQATSLCGEIELVHYCSLADVRFVSGCRSATKHAIDNLFSATVVLTTVNVAIVQQNVIEYPVREYGPDTIRGSPAFRQYQVMTVAPLIDCLELQLPGHDRSILTIVIKSSNQRYRNNKPLKIHLSICCQKEQKRLIDKLQQQRAKCAQTDTLLPVNVC